MFVFGTVEEGVGELSGTVCLRTLDTTSTLLEEDDSLELLDTEEDLCTMGEAVLGAVDLVVGVAVEGPANRRRPEV